MRNSVKTKLIGLMFVLAMILMLIPSTIITTFATNYTYSKLATIISNAQTTGDQITLEKDGVYVYDSGESIIINKSNFVLDGNGATINMDGSPNRAFTITGSNVLIKNLTIVNSNIIDYDGAMYFDCAGSVEYCTFYNNVATTGGAIYFNCDGGSVTNCAFVGNASGYGHAIYSTGELKSIEYNWWGSNDPNWYYLTYDQIPSTYAVFSATVNQNILYKDESTDIVTKFVWNDTNIIATPFLPERSVKLSSSNGNLSNISFNVGSKSQFTTPDVGVSQIKAVLDEETINIDITVLEFEPYCLVGNMTGWMLDDNYHLKENPEVDGEYYIDIGLTTESQFKIVYTGADPNVWYPEGMGTNIGQNGEITSDGKYRVYFRPNFNADDDWFYNCIYVQKTDVLWIGDTEVTDDVTSGDNWSYDSKTNTLTLNNYVYAGQFHEYDTLARACIYYNGDDPLNIVVEGNKNQILFSYIEAPGAYNVGVYAPKGGVIFSGDGKLEIRSFGPSIIGDTVVNGCSLSLGSNYQSSNIPATISNLTVNSGYVQVDGCSTSQTDEIAGYGIETLIMYGGIVKAYGGNGFFYAPSKAQSAIKNLTFYGGTLYAKGGMIDGSGEKRVAIPTNENGGSINTGKNVKAYYASSVMNGNDLPNILIKSESGFYDRYYYMVFEGESREVEVPYTEYKVVENKVVKEEKTVKSQTMTFDDSSTWNGTYYIDYSITFGTEDNPVTITLTDDVNLIFADNVTLYVYGTVEGNYKLNVYGSDSYYSGKFLVFNTGSQLATSPLALNVKTFAQHGGYVEIETDEGNCDGNEYAFKADNFIQYNGRFFISCYTSGVSCLKCDNVLIYGGTFNLSAGIATQNIHAGHGLYGNITVYDGTVVINGGSDLASSDYPGVGIIGTVTVYDGMAFIYGGSINSQTYKAKAIDGKVTLGEHVGYLDDSDSVYADGPVSNIDASTKGFALFEKGTMYLAYNKDTGEFEQKTAYDEVSLSQTLPYLLYNRWQVVDDNITVNVPLQLSLTTNKKEINIILKDGATFTVTNGFEIPSGYTLNIFAQSLDEKTMGKLIVTSSSNNAPGIELKGDLYIHGGIIEVTGGEGGAGIGSIPNNSSCGNVYIYGGRLISKTTGTSADGIGASSNSNGKGTITLGDSVLLYGADSQNDTLVRIKENQGEYARYPYMVAYYSISKIITLTSEKDSVIWSDLHLYDEKNWKIVGANDSYGVSIFSGETSAVAGTYTWDDFDSENCYVISFDTKKTIKLIDGSCTVTINNGVVNVSGIFTGEDGNTYIIDITYTPTSLDITATPSNYDITWIDATLANKNWTISISNDDYSLSLGNDSLDEAAGTYTWDNMDPSKCELTNESTKTTIRFIDGSCTVTLNDSNVLITGTFTGTDYVTYTFSILYSPATIDGTPTAAENLKYTGEDQILITQDPTVVGGTIMYSFDKTNWYTRENLKAKEVGSYEVYYYVASDANHCDSAIFGGADFVVEIDKATPTYTPLDSIDAVYGDTLSKFTLPTGWDWVLDKTTTVGNPGSNEFDVTFTPEDTDHYVVVNTKVTITVDKAKGETSKAATLSSWESSTVTISCYDETYTTIIEGQEYVIVPKGVTPDWNNAVELDKNGLYTFENLTPATIYSIYSRTKETDTTYAGDPVSIEFITSLTSVSTNGEYYVGVEIEVVLDLDNVEGLEYEWHYAKVTQIDEYTNEYKVDALISGATSSKYTPVIDDYDKYLCVIISKGGYILKEVIIDKISKRDIDLDFTLDNWTYGDNANTPNITGNAGNGDVTVTYSTEQTGTYSDTVPTDAGTYYVKVTVNETDEYFGASVIKSFKIERKAITVTPDYKQKTYGDDDPSLTYKVTGLVGTDTLSGTLERISGEDVDTYNITQGTLTNDNNPNYDITFIVNTLTIKPKTITVTADQKQKTYGDDEPVLTYKVTGLVGTDTLSGVLARISGENVGTYTIIQSTLAASDNYVLTFVGATLTINAKDIVVKANSASKTYGDSDPKLTYIVEGLVGDDTLTGSLTRVSGENVGTYTIIQSTLTNDNNPNYSIKFVSATFTISPKALTVSADQKQKTYGDDEPTLTYQVSGLVGTDTLSGSLTRVSGENIGTYAITQGTLVSGDNYKVNFTPGVLIITPKNISVKANDVSKTYGDSDPKLTYIVEGLVGDDTLTGSLTRVSGENVGTYAITQGTLVASDNYKVSFTTGALTITPKNISVKANDQRKSEGSNDPELTYVVEGLVGGDTLTGSLARASGENAGTYEIVQGTLVASNNYVLTFTGATLTIFEVRIETAINIGKNTPYVEISNMGEKELYSLLTDEEKEALKAGEIVRVYFEIVAIDEENVPNGDKNAINTTIKDSKIKVGMYLDFSLFKEVGNESAIAIHDTTGNMFKVKITIPEELRNTNPNVKRTFYVVRNHDGETAILGESDGNTISFETDKFSTYSLIYRDVSTISYTWLWIVLSVLAVAIIGFAVFFIIKKKNGKKESTK